VPATPSIDDPAATVASAGRPGRPRRYAAAEELQLLLDAAFEVIRRKGYGEATVGDILAESGLSTRSFYRHFGSKDELLHALFRRDAEQFAAAVKQRVEAAPNPAAALEVWIDEILGFGFDRPRTRRAAVLGSAAAKSSLDPDETRRALQLLVEPLVGVLTAGAADGSFPLVEPDGDAGLVSALAWETSARLGEVSARTAKQELRSQLLSLVHRALGVDALAERVGRASHRLALPRSGVASPA
jgi:AcrR family transcriptional regulator